MKFSVNVPGLTLFQGLGGQPAWARDITTEQIVAIVGRADELGYDYVPIPWHVAIQQGEDARNFGPRWPDSRSTAGFILGATSRIVVQPLFVVPCEQPISLAKAIATLDWISGGRAIPVLLTGYMQWEFELLGVPFVERVGIMGEYVEAMIELWSSDDPRFDGEYVQFRDMAFEPKPRQQPLPLWFGGRTKKALRLIARHGDGWQSYATPHSRMPEMLDYIRAQQTFVSNPRPLEVAAYFVEATHDPVTHEDRGGRRVIVGNDAVLEQLDYLGSVGVTVTNAPLDACPGPRGRTKPIDSVEEYIDRLEWFAEGFITQMSPSKAAARTAEATRGTTSG
jgi:alkanesulfonate monooxygenase SsuD/methylene tetrahydromethanopterin reductase-like flavin-dependent oxidoreductase (luciferase family)